MSTPQNGVGWMSQKNAKDSKNLGKWVVLPT